MLSFSCREVGQWFRKVEGLTIEGVVWSYRLRSSEYVILMCVSGDWRHQTDGFPAQNTVQALTKQGEPASGRLLIPDGTGNTFTRRFTGIRSVESSFKPCTMEYKWNTSVNVASTFLLRLCHLLYCQ